ncbi:MAG: hypothetical protein A7316_01315 [Candidatus Altiarchaeales archaeon WOR_SM1_86-2]|nr:MAG: hypothetical protein A7316_01315 [Candidatus Altiarchaeales archaeon WOR_SM1_86-2]
MSVIKKIKMIKEDPASVVNEIFESKRPKKVSLVYTAPVVIGIPACLIMLCFVIYLGVIAVQHLIEEGDIIGHGHILLIILLIALFSIAVLISIFRVLDNRWKEKLFESNRQELVNFFQRLKFRNSLSEHDRVEIEKKIERLEEGVGVEGYYTLRLTGEEARRLKLMCLYENKNAYQRNLDDGFNAILTKGVCYAGMSEPGYDPEDPEGLCFARFRNTRGTLTSMDSGLYRFVGYTKKEGILFPSTQKISFSFRPKAVHINGDNLEIAFIGIEGMECRALWFEIDENFEVFKKITGATKSRLNEINRSNFIDLILKWDGERLLFGIVGYYIGLFILVIGAVIVTVYVYYNTDSGAGIIAVIFWLLIILGIYQRHKIEKVKRGDINCLFEGYFDPVWYPREWAPR